MKIIDKICVAARTLIYHLFYVLFVCAVFEFNDSADIIILCSLIVFTVSDTVLVCGRGRSFRTIALIELIAIAALSILRMNPKILDVMLGIYALSILQLLLCIISILICINGFHMTDTPAHIDVHAAVIGHIAFGIIPVIALLLINSTRIVAAATSSIWTFSYAIIVGVHIKKTWNYPSL